MFDIYELPIIACKYMEDWKQFRFPRSKKRRIKKKWQKQARNFRMVPQSKIFQIGNSFYAHPAVVAEFLKRLEAKSRQVDHVF